MAILMILLSLACFYWGFTHENYFLVSVGIFCATMAIVSWSQADNSQEEA